MGHTCEKEPFSLCYTGGRRNGSLVLFIDEWTLRVSPYRTVQYPFGRALPGSSFIFHCDYGSGVLLVLLSTGPDCRSEACAPFVTSHVRGHTCEHVFITQ